MNKNNIQLTNNVGVTTIVLINLYYYKSKRLPAYNRITLANSLLTFSLNLNNAIVIRTIVRYKPITGFLHKSIRYVR